MKLKNVLFGTSYTPSYTMTGVRRVIAENPITIAGSRRFRGAPE
jgi:hypothetical protein